MSPVTTTEAQRTAAQSGPFPGVGVGAASECSTATPPASIRRLVPPAPAVVPAAAGEPERAVFRAGADAAGSHRGHEGDRCGRGEQDGRAAWG